jgi:hypothetical protein
MARAHALNMASFMGGRGTRWKGTVWKQPWVSDRLTQAAQRRQKPQCPSQINQCFAGSPT